MEAGVFDHVWEYRVFEAIVPAVVALFILMVKQRHGEQSQREQNEIDGNARHNCYLNLLSDDPNDG